MCATSASGLEIAAISSDVTVGFILNGGPDGIRSPLVLTPRSCGGTFEGSHGRRDDELFLLRRLHADAW